MNILSSSLFLVLFFLFPSFSDQSVPAGNWGPPYFYPADPNDRPYRAPWKKGKAYLVNGGYFTDTHSGYKHPDYSIDLDADSAEPVLAARAGKIHALTTGDLDCNSSSYGGNCVYVSRPDSVPDSTRPSGWRLVLSVDKYLHVNNNIPVKIGQSVRQGEVIAYVSCTGTYYPHIHFEVNIKGHQGTDPAKPGYTFESVPAPFVEMNRHRDNLPEKGDTIVSRNELGVYVEKSPPAVMDGISVWPNPARSGGIKFATPSSFLAPSLVKGSPPPSSFLIFDLHGRRVASASGALWDARNFPAGLYVVTAAVNGKTISKRFVVCR